MHEQTRRLVAVRRQLLPLDHQQLRSHIQEVNTGLPDISVKWRRLGEAGITLLEPREYVHQTQMERSRLYAKRPGDVAELLNAELRKGTTGERKTAPVRGVDFFGSSRFLSIAYVLEPGSFEEECARVRQLVNRYNGVNGSWEEFAAHATVATIERVHAEQVVLDAFASFQPEELRFLAAKAQIV
jgi:hypothetical protein